MRREQRLLKRWQAHAIVWVTLLIVILWAKAFPITEQDRVPILQDRDTYGDTVLYGTTDTLYIKAVVIQGPGGDSSKFIGWIIADSIVTANSIYLGTSLGLCLDSALLDSMFHQSGRFAQGGSGDSSWYNIHVDTILGLSGNNIVIGDTSAIVIATYVDSIIVFQKVFLGENDADSQFLTKAYIEELAAAGGTSTTNAESLYTVPIASAASTPSNSQVLKYNSTSGEWELASDETGGAADSNAIRYQTDSIQPYSGTEIVIGDPDSANVHVYGDSAAFLLTYIFKGANEADSLLVTWGSMQIEIGDTVAAHWAAWVAGDDSSWKSIDVDTLGGYTGSWIVALHKIFIGDNTSDSALMTKKWISDQIGAAGGGDVTDVIGGNGLIDNGNTGDITIDLLPGWGIRIDNDSTEVDWAEASDSAGKQIGDTVSAHWSDWMAGSDSVMYADSAGYADEAGSYIETDPTLTDDGTVTIGDGTQTTIGLTFDASTASDGVISYDGPNQRFVISRSLMCSDDILTGVDAPVQSDYFTNRDAGGPVLLGANQADSAGVTWYSLTNLGYATQVNIHDSLEANWATLTADDTVTSYREAAHDTLWANTPGYLTTQENIVVSDSNAATADLADSTDGGSIRAETAKVADSALAISDDAIYTDKIVDQEVKADDVDSTGETFVMENLRIKTDALIEGTLTVDSMGVDFSYPLIVSAAGTGVYLKAEEDSLQLTPKDTVRRIAHDTTYAHISDTVIIWLDPEAGGWVLADGYGADTSATDSMIVSADGQSAYGCYIAIGGYASTTDYTRHFIYQCTRPTNCDSLIGFRLTGITTDAADIIAGYLRQTTSDSSGAAFYYAAANVTDADTLSGTTIDTLYLMNDETYDDGEYASVHVIVKQTTADQWGNEQKMFRAWWIWHQK